MHSSSMTVSLDFEEHFELISSQCTLESANEDLMVVATRFPQRKSSKFSPLDEFPFGSEGLRVVIGNHDLQALVVQVRLAMSE